MIVRSVRLTNFRCHEQYELECEEFTTLILGENGCGKTSVLEAIYVALAGKSFRAIDAELLRRGAEFYRIELVRTDGEKYVVTYEPAAGKTYALTEKKYKRLTAKHKYPIILFEPVDLNLVAASPGRRRDYFDRLMGQLDPKYSNSLSRYEKAVRQRNELLRDEWAEQETLYSWDVMIAGLGAEIARRRRRMAELLNEQLTDKYRTIADNEDTVELRYKTEVSETAADYLAALMERFAKDKVLGHTGYGVHRDDFRFIFNGNEAEGSASRGELRSIVLAMKFIEAEMVEKILKKKPLILLDDVFSELDETRQECLKMNFKNHQIIITSVK